MRSDAFPPERQEAELQMAQYAEYSPIPVKSCAQWVIPLIDACRETQVTFEISAGGTRDRLLRAELLQYSGQRREFIAELIAAARKYCNQIIDPGSVRDSLARQCDTLKGAVSQNDTATLLSKCEHSEALATEAYRNVYAMELPTAIHAMVNTHLAAIKRVQDRLQRLRLNVQSNRN